MCGIFGYIGEKNAVKEAIEGLLKLEYRGYDSAGIAWFENDKLYCEKKAGKIKVLQEALKEKAQGHLAIAHTRWATHGEPSDQNAHPHFDQHQKVALVHNGIIENHEALRKMLQEKGVKFQSETDTEVVAQLVAFFDQDNLLEAVKKTVALLEGAYALVIVHKQYPHQMICVAQQSPLAIGQGSGEMFVASDANAFLEKTNKVMFLQNKEIAVVTKDKIETYDENTTKITKELEEISHSVKQVSKGDYEHFMLKEIHEQKQTVLNAFYGRIAWEYGTSFFEQMQSSVSDLLKIERIIIVACGTSWHAGLVAHYLFGERARIPVELEVSSEFRYKNPIVYPNTLAIAISQSGETADTLAALKELKRKGARTIGICNVQGSSIAREVDTPLFLKAGPEIGVASTKAFTSQVVVLSLLALKFARMRMMSQGEGERFISNIVALPRQIDTILKREEQIKALGKKYASYENMFFLGRKYMYPTALEGALKLKEIAYVNANGYPAGEMKHGPIALINESCPTVAYCANETTHQKILSNLMEVKARKGLICAVCFEKDTEAAKIADDVFYIPNTIDELAPITATVFSQLFAYYIAKERGTEIDQPRNLAKSVTVE